jgi:hypothetical protein
MPYALVRQSSFVRSFVALACLLLAGCTSLAPSTLPAPLAGTQVCARLALNESAPQLVVNVTSVTFTATLQNCGSVPLEHGGSQRCGDGPNILLSLGSSEYAFGPGSGNVSPTNTSINAVSWGPCPIVDHSTDLKPGQVASIRATWNGSLVDYECVVNASSSGSSSTCTPSTGTAQSATWNVRVDFAASDGLTRYDWDAQRTLVVRDAPKCVSCPTELGGLITASPVDLTKVSAFSRARTSDAPPAPNDSKQVCDCGFMQFDAVNPYKCPPTMPACPGPAAPPLSVYAPFRGVVQAVHDSTYGHVAYIVLASADSPSTSFWIVNAQPAEGIVQGLAVGPGALLARGYVALGIEDNSTWKGYSTPQVVPLSDLFAPNVAHYFDSFGIDVTNLTYPAGSRATNTLTCDPTEGRLGPASPGETIEVPH